MKFFVTIVLLLFCCSVSAQQREAEQLDSMLVKQDPKLILLLHPKLSFGHSNGWIQNAGEVIEDMQSGKLAYREIGNSAVQWTIEGRTAVRRSLSNVQYALEGKEGSLKLHVVQTWVQVKNKGWQLLARQSVKVD